MRRQSLNLHSIEMECTQARVPVPQMRKKKAARRGGIFCQRGMFLRMRFRVAPRRGGRVLQAENQGTRGAYLEAKSCGVALARFLA
jgi:hypothetical protein